MTIEDRQQEIINEFADIEEWMDRYIYIIDLGNEIPLIDEHRKTPDRKIEGCQSDVWLDARYEDGKVYYTGDSNTSIIKGVVSMIIDVLSGHTPDEILQADLHFLNDIGLSENLSSNRANGVLAMIKQMKMYALAFKSKE